MPRSPWLASLGCTKKAGVPVEAKVAAIFWPTWPLLPMPVTITRPLAAASSCNGHAERLLQLLVERRPQRLQALAFEVERAHGRLRRVRYEHPQVA